MFIELKNVTKIYPGAKTKALDDVSLSFKQGETVALLGVNGSGKTTCSSILCGLHKMTKGSLYFDGKEIKNDIAQYRQNIGYCPQNCTLNDNISVYDNLLQGALFYGLDSIQAEKATEKIISLFSMHKYIDKMPPTLSGGWIQRVMIARSIIHDPQFVILDEPTVGLDPAIRHTIWKIIEQLKMAGKTLIITTHYLDEADLLCDRIVIIDEGKILRDCTKESLKNEHENKDLEAIFIKLTQEIENEKEE